MMNHLVTSLRDRVQLRSRLRRVKVLYWDEASAPPSPAENAVDPARLGDFSAVIDARSEGSSRFVSRNGPSATGLPSLPSGRPIVTMSS